MTRAEISTPMTELSSVEKPMQLVYLTLPSISTLGATARSPGFYRAEKLRHVKIFRHFFVDETVNLTVIFGLI